MVINDLPPEILGEILLRLPITTLTTTARLVNRAWFCIISSSEFVKARLKSSTLSDHRVVFTDTTSGLLLDLVSMDSLSCDSPRIDLVKFGYNKSLGHTVWLVGSCNGLICVSEGRRVIVLNPCTGKYNKLRPLDLDYLEPRHGRRGRDAAPHISYRFGYDESKRSRPPHISYGFGYDEPNDDYKVVAVWVPHQEGVGDKKNFCYIVKVFSLKTNSWRRIEDFKGGVICSGFGKLASGKLYWLTNCEIGAYLQRRIVSFDVGSEVFGVIELPVDYSCTRLDVLRGCICLLVDYDRSHADLWVMKEYGVKESWIKMVTVSYTNVPEKLNTCSLLPNGEILLCANYESFVVYNPNDGSFKFLDKASLDPSYGSPLIYVQSLVSPICLKCEGERKQSWCERYARD